LESAIHAINPNGLSEQDLIEKIRTRMLSELSEDDVIKELERLDEIFLADSTNKRNRRVIVLGG
jgi:hypothetical protein